MGVFVHARLPSCWYTKFDQSFEAIVLTLSSRFVLRTFVAVLVGSDAVREAVEKAFAEEIGKLVEGINDRVAEIWTGTAPESKVQDVW